MANLHGGWAPHVVGIDLGNATTSGMTMEGEARVAFFPSVIASIGVPPYNGMSKVSGSYHHVTYEGKHYVVGEEAFHEMGAYPLLSNLEASEAWTRYISPESMVCFLASVSVMHPESDMVSIDLATGAPLSLYHPHGKKIAERYIGEHRYTYNGHERTVIVANAKCFGEGRETLRLVPKEERTGKIAVYDLGGRTLNVVFFHNGDERRVVTKDFGIDRLFDSITSVDRDIAVRWRVMREMRDNPRAHQAVREQLVAYLEQAINVIRRDVRLDLADRHYVIGGGAFLLERALKQHVQHVRVLNGKSPETANARAFALAMAGM